MSLAVAAQGTLLKVESSTSAGTFTTVPECTKIGAPNVKYDLLDVTSHDSSGWREFLPGLMDGESVTADLHFVPSNAIHIQLRTDQYAKNKRNFQVIFPGGGTGAQVQAAAYIQSLPFQADVNAIISGSLSAKVTASPEWT